MTDSITSTTPIRLGLLSPLTGLVSIYGQEIVWAGQIACAEVNAAGGVLGRPLELIVADDGSLPETAVPAAERLLDESGCVALIGNLLSNSRIAVASQVADVRQVPYLNFSFYEGSIHSRYFFHFAALPNQQIDRMIPYMAREMGAKMFFAGSNYEWPRGSIDAAMRALRDWGGEVVGEDYFPLGQAPIDELLDRVRYSGADVFVPYFVGSEQAQLLTRFAQLGLQRRMAVVMGHYDEAMAATLAPEVREGLYSCNTYFMALTTPANHRYLQALAALPEVSGLWPAGNGVLTNFGEGVYLCVQAFAHAVNQAGSLQTDAVLAALEQVTIDGPQGTVCMDAATHHAHVNTYLARGTLDGRFEIVTAFGRLPPHIPERYRANAQRTSQRPDPQPAAATLTATATDTTHDSILANIDIGVLAISADGLIAEANRRGADMFGYSVAELLGLPLHELIPPQFRPAHAGHIAHFLQEPASERRMSQRPELSGYRKDGSMFPIEISLSQVRTGNRTLIVATLLDITNRKRAEEELVWQAIHDPLTGLPNRTLFQERLERALRRSKRQGASVALLCIDLDGFKLVNDSHGHQIGDELLKTIGQRLVDHVRPGDTIARLGGDEFIVLCEHIDTPATVASLADRINDLLREPITILGQQLFATASIGLAIGHGTTHSADDLLRNADAAMYQAKEQGRDGWRFFSEEIHEQARRRLDITNGLRQAIERDEFQIRFQPILCAQTQIVRGAELLLRWFPSGGEVSPAHFIPIAEMSGSIVPIGKWVFQQACFAERQWRDQFGTEAPYVSVNVSARQLNDDGLVDEFRAMLTASGADPERIVLELTETSLMSDVIFNLSVLHQLASLGLRVAVDDFGTGYSSLAQLLRLPLSTLKIDREFVDGLDKRHDSRAIVRAVCGMARAMNLKVIAEGVENASQFGYLRDLGCDYVQGFHFYRPLPPDEFVSLLHESSAAGRLATSDDLYSLLYVSQSVRPMNESELKTLLDGARELNRAQGITGFLLYFNQSFMQILEGQRSRLQAVWERIRRDPRHHNLRIVFEGGIQQRAFVGWSMGFRDIEHIRPGSVFQGQCGRAIDFLEMAQDPRVCYNFIIAFAPENQSPPTNWDGGRDDPRR